MTVTFDKLNNIGISFMENCDTASDVNEILEVNEDTDISDSEYLSSATVTGVHSSKAVG